MKEEKLEGKIIVIRRVCPMCRKTFTYFCQTCYFLMSLENSYHFVHRHISPRNDNVCYSEENNEGLSRFTSTLAKKGMQNFLDKVDWEKSLICHLVDKKTHDTRLLLIKGKFEDIPKAHTDTSLAKFENKQNACDNISVSSLKSKKSGNILSNFIRKNKKKKIKSSEYLNVPLDQEGHSNYSFCSVKEEKDEIELNSEFYCEKVESSLRNKNKYKSNKDKALGDNISDSEQSCSSSNSPTEKYNSYSRKLIKKHPSNENVKDGRCITEHGTCTCTSYREMETYGSVVTVISEQEQFPEEKTDILPLAYIKHRKHHLDITLAEALNELQEMSKNYKESESHLMGIITKYIEDQELRKELVETLTQHSLMQWETERRTNSLANEMWIQQTDIFRCQEKTLQESLFSLVQQNRSLQTDNELLTRSNERLLIKLRNTPDYIRAKSFDCGNSVLENFTKNNEKQQQKIHCLLGQLELLENELNILQKEYKSMEQCKNNYGTQLENLKAIIQRSKTDYELERTALNFQLKTNQQIIKDTVEAGDVVLEDLDALKRQIKDLPFSINWTKFKNRGSCVTDLVHLCRSCINELSRELISSHNQLTLKDKDLLSLRETNNRLQENLRKSASQLDNVSKGMEEYSNLEVQKDQAQQKCVTLENEILSLKHDLLHIKEEHEVEKRLLLDKVEHIERVNSEITEKNKFLEESKHVISAVTAENLCLTNQLEALRKNTNKSEIEEMKKALSLSEDKILFLHEQYCEVNSKKNYLAEKSEYLALENGKLLQNQQAMYSQMQSIQLNSELVAKESLVLKQNLTELQQTINTLQMERKKYLDERGVLRSIFNHLKAEINRCQHLEGTVVDISKEANRLALIAEYNRKIGEKLKNEVEVRDIRILELSGSVEKLNNVQLENTKEKITLCAELSEVSKLKDHLNSTLAMESQKVKALNQATKEIEDTTSIKLKELKEIQITNKKEMDEVMGNFWVVVRERNALIKSQAQYRKEIDFLKTETKVHVKTCGDIMTKSSEAENKLKEISQKLETQDETIKKLIAKIKSESAKYETTLRTMDGLIKQSKKEKENLEKSLEYLKNNGQKTFNELNESRKVVVELEGSLKKEIEKCKVAEQESLSSKTELSHLKEEKRLLKDEICYLQGMCNKLLKDLDLKVGSSLEKEAAFKEDVESFRKLIDTTEEEVAKLKQIIEVKEKEIRTIEWELNQLKKQNCELTLTKTSSDMQLRKIEELREEKRNIEEKLFNIQLEHGSCPVQVENMKKEITRLNAQMDILVKQKDDENNYFKTHLDDLFQEYNERKQIMKHELTSMTDQLKFANESLQNEKLENRKLSKNYEEVSSKLMNTIQSLLDEKANKREATSRIAELKADIARLKSERYILQTHTKELITSIHDEKNRINNLEKDNLSANCMLEDVQKRYTDILARCANLENEVKCLTSKNQDPTSRSTSQEQVKEITTNERQELPEQPHESDRDIKINYLSAELEECYSTILQLKEELSTLRKQITCLEFQKCELTLRLHESQGKLDTERKLYEQLKHENQSILAVLVQMRDEGKVASSDYTDLLYKVQSLTDVNTETNLTVTIATDS